MIFHVYSYKRNRLLHLFSHILTFFFLFILLFSAKDTLAKEVIIYKDGVYNFVMSDTNKKEVTFIGVDGIEKQTELYIPSSATINGITYSVTSTSLHYYTALLQQENPYSNIERIIIDGNFTGEFIDFTFYYPKLHTIQFLGTTHIPSLIDICFDYKKPIAFHVPSGYEEIYNNLLHTYISYYKVSDLYEHDITIFPTIITTASQTLEYTYFYQGDFIYKVTKSGKNKIGEVELIGLTLGKKQLEYLSLSSTVTNDNFTYNLTSLGRFSLIGTGAKVVVLPDTITNMSSLVFDHEVELLFLSKNATSIPRNLISDNDDNSELRFLYVPEGVTTLSDYAFHSTPGNTSSIILPSTIKSVGKNSLIHFNLITFPHKKPLESLSAAIKKGSTIKVIKESISNYKKVLSNKYFIKESKQVSLAKSLNLSASSLDLTTETTATMKATLTKGSNETIYWLSTNPNVVDVTSKGVLIPKSSGTTTIVAYTRTSGLHKTVTIKVSDYRFTSGIYTYHINNPYNKTVTVTRITPTSTTKSLNIPKTVTHKSIKYTINQVIADTTDTSVALIPNDYKKNKITSITFPKTLSETVGYLGIINNIKIITFLGSNAPDSIQNWYLDNGLLAYQAIIYVPKGSASSYTKALWMTVSDTMYATTHYNATMDFNIVESGNKQVQRFLVDGILYRVTTYANTKPGKVYVKGFDRSSKNIKINKTVTYNGYTYNVIGIHKNVTEKLLDINAIIDSSLTKRNLEDSFIS